ncbi:MAG: hypothetical protein K8L99_03040 [Anaerolineae bacterium]|nr:hypothetical protein [Anaerolineae bacterium]
MGQPTYGPRGKKSLKIGWIFALGLILYMIWVIYTADQTQVVDVDNGSMNMPGMERPSDMQITLTPMPSNMPDMGN